MLTWLVVRFFISFDELFIAKNNFVNLKTILGGGLLLTFIYFLTTISIPLNYFKLWIKISFYSTIGFVILSPFVFQSKLINIENFTRYYFSGSIFLFLLFPYQRKNVNLWQIFGLILSIFFMLITARRNMVLYFISAIVFLGLVLLFSKSQILKSKKATIIFVSSLVIFLIVNILVISQTRFDLFFDRVNTGGQSREEIVTEFVDDFNSHNIDWLIGRGPFGSFHATLLATDGDRRYAIENGYLQIILKSGLFTLLPFLIISIESVLKGFFMSKNHLSKSAAIIVLVNLIDMIGFGVPFIGPKYVNIFIAIGFCISPFIRNLNDFQIKKHIRI
jgi:hypothetical protein